MKWTIEQVYRDPIFHALNPKGKKFMGGRWLTRGLNEFLVPYEIRIAALISFLTLPHIKSVPTIGMMLEDFKEGRYEGMHTIVVPSSGNTAHAVARLARAFGFSEVKAVLSTDVPPSKKELLAALSSVEIIEVGGGKSIAKRAQEEGQKQGHYLLDQYQHMGNVRSHFDFTGPEILRLLGENLAVIAIAMGSGGTVAGVGRYLKQNRPGTVVLGVRPILGQQVPGTRDEKRMAEVAYWTRRFRGSVCVGNGDFEGQSICKKTSVRESVRYLFQHANL